jgi:hypothetical protein
MKILVLTFALSLIMEANLAFAIEAQPKGAIKKHARTNEKLVRDALIGVVGRVAIMGCSNPESFKPYRVPDHKGKTGAHVWWEVWTVLGCNDKYSIVIRFNDDGKSVANWTIE